MGAWGGLTFGTPQGPQPQWSKDGPGTWGWNGVTGGSGSASSGAQFVPSGDDELDAFQQRMGAGYELWRDTDGSIVGVFRGDETADGEPAKIISFTSPVKGAGGSGGDGSAWANLAQRQTEFEYEKTQDALAADLANRKFASEDRNASNTLKLQERQQALSERELVIQQLESSQDRMLKQAEMLDNAKLTRAQMSEQARQFGIQQTMQQWQTAMSLIPQLGELSIRESERVQKVLENGTDFVYRAFESRGEKSPLARVTQADQINAIHQSMNQLRDFMTNIPPVVIPEIDMPDMPTFGTDGAGMAGMPPPVPAAQLDYGSPAGTAAAPGTTAAASGMPAGGWGQSYGEGGSMPALAPAPAPSYDPSSDRDSWESPGGDTNLPVPTYHGPAKMSDKAAHASEEGYVAPSAAIPAWQWGSGDEEAMGAARGDDYGEPVKGPYASAPSKPGADYLGNIGEIDWRSLLGGLFTPSEGSRYAKGGPAPMGEPALVGEEGYEIAIPTPSGMEVIPHEQAKEIVGVDGQMKGYDEGTSWGGMNREERNRSYTRQTMNELSDADFGEMAGSMFGGGVSTGGRGMWGALASRFGGKPVPHVVPRNMLIHTRASGIAPEARASYFPAGRPGDMKGYAQGTYDPFQTYNTNAQSGSGPYDATAALSGFNSAMAPYQNPGGVQQGAYDGSRAAFDSRLAGLKAPGSPYENLNFMDYNTSMGLDQYGRKKYDQWGNLLGSAGAARDAARAGGGQGGGPQKTDLSGIDFGSLLKRAFPNQAMVSQDELVAAADKVLPPAIRDTLAGKYAAPLRLPEAMGDAPTARALSLLTREEQDALGNYTGLKYNTTGQNIADVTQRTFGVPAGAARRAMVAGRGI